MITLRRLPNFVWTLCETTQRSFFRKLSQSRPYLQLLTNVEQDQIDTAIGTYIAMLDQRDNIQRLAAIRGERSGANYEQPEDERAQALSSASKRHRSESPSTRTSTKRRSPDETLFAWLVNDEADTTVLTASQELTHKLVENHVLDLKASKRMVLASKRVPEFPDSEWNNVLAGKVVNLDVFSPACTPRSQTTGPSKTSEILNFISAPQNPPKLLKRMGIGSSRGELPLKPPNLFFPIAKPNLKNTTTTLLHISHRSSLAHTQRSLTSIEPSGNMWDPSTMYPLTSSTNSATSKHVISKDMALAKAAPVQMRK